MTPLAHFSSGYLVYSSVAQSYNNMDSSLLLGISLVGSMAPDIDGLFGARMKDHRSTPFHAPLVWLVFSVVAFSSTQSIAPSWIPFVVAFFMGVFMHLFLDWVSARTSGVMLLYPFSKKFYALFPTRPDKGDVPTLPGKTQFKAWLGFWGFYFSDTFLVFLEVVVIVSPVFVWLSR